MVFVVQVVKVNVMESKKTHAQNSKRILFLKSIEFFDQFLFLVFVRNSKVVRTAEQNNPKKLRNFLQMILVLIGLQGRQN